VCCLRWQGDGIRALSDLINVYHATVGSNSVLELDFAIDRTGRVDPTHAARYKEVGWLVRVGFSYSRLLLHGARSVAVVGLLCCAPA
jgi:hypothetical protein